MRIRTGPDALRRAVFVGNLLAAKRAVDEGADVGARDRAGRTPLFDAVIEARADIASMLIERGADVRAQDKRGETPLHFAARKCLLELAQLLLAHGAIVDAQDCHGNTPLSTAVFESRGRGEMIGLLLRHSANKSLKNKHRVSPEDLANSIRNYDVKRFLE